MSFALTVLFAFSLIMYFTLDKLCKRVKKIEASLDEVARAAKPSAGNEYV